MTNIRYVPFWEDDFEADTLGMKPEHKWIYWKVCVAITRSDTGWVKDDDNWISARVGISPARWRRSRGTFEDHLEHKTDDNDIKWISQKRARREHGVATVKLRGNQKGGQATRDKDSTKKQKPKKKPSKNKDNPPSQLGGQVDGQPYGQLPSQPHGQPLSNRTEQKVISIEEITSARASEDLAKWILRVTKIDKNPIPIPMHLVMTWERNYHIDDIKGSIEKVVKQSSYDPKKVKGLSYFVPAINEAYEKRLAKLDKKIDAKVKGMVDDDWRELVGLWIEGRTWPENCGPDPEQETTHVPRIVAREFAGAIAARTQLKKSANGSDETVDFDSE